MILQNLKIKYLKSIFLSILNNIILSKNYLILLFSRFSNFFFKSRIDSQILDKFIKEGYINNNIDFDDLIQGDKFVELANRIDIHYSNTHNVNSFFTSKFNGEFILISHNSDACVTNNPRQINLVKSHEHADVSLMPKNLKFWFAQNVEVFQPNIIPIPIGFPNNFYYSNNFTLLEENKRSERKIKNLVYLNSNIRNNYNIRSKIYDYFKYKNYTTVVKGRHGVGFKNFISDLRAHLFVLCPEGNGIDTHLIWEAIAQDCIPIVKLNNNNFMVRDALPILWVRDFREINDLEYLFSEYCRIVNCKFNLKEYHFSFWKELILEKGNSLNK